MVWHAFRGREISMQCYLLYACYLFTWMASIFKDEGKRGRKRKRKGKKNEETKRKGKEKPGDDLGGISL